MLSKTFFILLGLLLAHFYFPATAEADDEDSGGSGHSGGSGSMDHDKKETTTKKPEAADKTEDKGGSGHMDHGKDGSGTLVCISATHHKMPDGTEMLNSEMSPDPCAGCTEYPCEPESSGKSGHKHDHAGHEHAGHDKVGTGAKSTAAPTTTELDSAQADTATTSSKPQSKVVFLLVSIAVFASLV